MKQNVSEYNFRNAFTDYGREGNFSYKGLGALYNYLIELEEDCDMNIELDVIAFCCEYSEYEDLEEIQSNYNDIESLEDMRDRTQVIEFDGGIIIQDY